jgi:hypothetical protein
MRFSLPGAGALIVMTLAGAGSALAFTFENPGGVNPGASTPNGTAGYAAADPGSLLPPIGESVPGIRFDNSPSSGNNGFASPPDPRNSIGPGWLYGPR